MKLSVKFKFYHFYMPNGTFIFGKRNDCQLRGSKRITEHFAEFND
jgi:hypothetical protein